MSRFINKAKEIIADQSEGKFAKGKVTNKKITKFLFSLFQARSNDKIDKNDLIKCEQQKNHITFLVNFFMSETYIDNEEEDKKTMLKLLKDPNYVNGINILDCYNQLKPNSTDDQILFRKNIISIIKTKPNIKVDIIKIDNSIEYNEEYFYNMVSNGKALIQGLIEKYKIKQVFEYNPNLFDEIIDNHQSFNVKCLFSLNEYLENFDKIFKLYNNFNSVFKQIEKINNILISKKIMDDDCQKYIQNVYSGFEKGSNDINLSFDKKIAKLSNSIKKLENEHKKIRKRYEECQEKNKRIEKWENKRIRK